MKNQNIEDYLIKKHLKPLFIFSFNNQTDFYGLFVGSKGKPAGEDMDFDVSGFPRTLDKGNARNAKSPLS